MSQGSSRDTVLRLYRAARAAPNSPHDPDRFLAFLTEPPAEGRRVSDTFAGRRCLVRLLEGVQLECGVCFSNEDWDRAWTFDRFVQAVDEKTAKPAYGLRLVRDRRRAARARITGDPVKSGLLGLPLLVIAAVSRGAWWGWLCAGLWLCLTGGVFVLARREAQYLERLEAAIA